MNEKNKEQKNIHSREGLRPEQTPQQPSSLYIKLGEALIALGTKIKYGGNSQHIAFERPEIEIEIIQI